jgi:hypothetical protein
MGIATTWTLCASQTLSFFPFGCSSITCPEAPPLAQKAIRKKRALCPFLPDAFLSIRQCFLIGSFRAELILRCLLSRLHFLYVNGNLVDLAGKLIELDQTLYALNTTISDSAKQHLR